MAMKRPRRIRGNKANYCELIQCRIPHDCRAKSKGADLLYPIEKISSDSEEQCNGDRVKVHYIGFSNHYDEWKDIEEIEDVTGVDESPDQLTSVYALIPFTEV